MHKIVLKATRRTNTGKTVKQLRRQGLLPAVMYGHHFEPIAITLDLHTTSMALAGQSSSAIVNIELDGQTHAALVREKQRNYIKNELIHIDFQIVSLTEKIRTAVRLTLTGVSAAVRDDNAVMMHSLSQVEVEALPGDLPEHISVSIDNLAKVGDAIYVRDLVVPAGVEILTPAEEMVAVVTSAAKEEEVVEAEPVIEPEVIERGKKPEEEAE